MAYDRIPVGLDAGLHTKENSLDVPDGALVYARNAEYRGLSKGLARRRGRADLNATVLSATPARGLIQYQTTTGTYDQIVAVGAGTLFYGSTGATVTFASGDTALGNAGPTTFIFYNERLYTSSGSGTPRVWNGVTGRGAGLAAGGNLLQVNAVVGSGITVTHGFHFTWRYADLTNKVRSDVANAGGKILYASYTTTGAIQGFAITGFPTAAPSGSSATHVELLMTADELAPSTFYVMAQVALGTGPTYFPTGITNTSGAIFNFPLRAYDGVVSLTPRMFLSLAYAVCANTDAANHEARFAFSYSPNDTRSDWQLSVGWMYFDASSGTATPGTIQYSTNGGGAWTTLATLTDTSAVNTTTSTATLSGSIAVNSIIVRTVMTRGADATVSTKQQILGIDDIRLTAGGSGSSRTTIFAIPTADEDFITAGNVGQFQPPPARLFPTIFDGHLVGVGTTNGLYLAYSRTDEPEHWSTNPNLASFPYMIPFKEKEADSVFGAERAGNNLIVFCGDSVWRINHLPVISDPEGSQADLFAEARATVKVRVTDTVGCVGYRAYARVQLGSDQDLVLFWSHIGPMLTDGFRVWRAAPHVDWSFLSVGLSQTVIANDTTNRRMLVALRTASATLNDVVYTFHYDPDHIIEGKQGPQFKVVGPWDAAFADIAEVTLTTGQKVMVATANATSGAEAGQLYLLDSGTADSDTGLTPSFQFVTKRLGVAGNITTFAAMVANVQETGDRAFTIGASSVTPSMPIDKDPLTLSAAAQSLEIDWTDDTVTARGIYENEQVTQTIMPAETMTFTTSDRIINHFSLYVKAGERVKD